MSAPATGPGGATSRRQLLSRALVGAGAAGLGGRAAASAQSLPALAPDAQVLSHLLDVERKLTATYRTVLSSDVLNVFVAGRVSGLLDQERQHIGALEAELGRLGTPQTLALPSSVATPQSSADALNTLITAESLAESACADAVATLQDPRLIALAAEIMASEAQHWTVLTLLLAPADLQGAVPGAFVD